MFQFTQPMHYSDTCITQCLLCQQACGGHSSTFPCPLSLSSLHLHFLPSSPFFVFFWSFFCSVALSLLSPPLCLSCTNVISHQCYFALLLSRADLLSSRSTLSRLVDTYFPPFAPSVFSVPPAHSCFLSAVLFWIFNRFWSPHSLLSPAIHITLDLHTLARDISSPTFFLLHTLLIRCTFILQQVIISMAIHTRELSGCY